MRFLVLGINYAPELIGCAVYSAGLAETMARHGHRVDVVTAHPYYPAWHAPQGWPTRGYRVERPAEGLTVTHCPLYVPAVPTAKSRLLHYASFTLSAAPRMLWQALAHRPDVVLVVAPSLVSAPLGWAIARLFGARCWLHVQDFEVEAAFATGILPPAGRLARAARGFESWVLRRFDRVSSISRAMLDRLAEKGVAPGRIVELRNWADLARVQPLQEPSPLKTELGIATRHVALYSGTVALKQGLEILPDLARRLAHRTDLTLAICGEGPCLPRLKALAEGLDNVRFLPLQPLERLSESLGMADVHLLPQIAGAADLVLPSKLTNMLASGRPVLATALAGTALAQEVEGCGRIVPPGDAAAMARALEALLDAPEERHALGLAARARAGARWHMGRILDRFETEALALAGPRAARRPTRGATPGALPSSEARRAEDALPRAVSMTGRGQPAEDFETA